VNGETKDAEERKNMKPVRIIFAVIATFFVTTALAASMAATSGKDVPAVKAQLQSLTEKLSLTSDQQAKVEPILRELYVETQRLLQDTSISQQERLDRVKPLRMQADKRLRAILSDDQRKKLDAFEQEQHPDMHSGLNAENH
jgi:hypothetical protein